MTKAQKNLLWKYLCSLSLAQIMDIHGTTRWDMQDDIVERDLDVDDSEDLKDLLKKAKKWKAKQRKKK